MMIEEKLDISLAKDHLRFIEELKYFDENWDFKDCKCKFEYKDNSLIFDKSKSIILDTQAIIYIMCLDNFIMYIGTNGKFSGLENYATGGSDSNRTYKRIRLELKNIGKSVKSRVKIFCARIKSDKSNSIGEFYKLKIQDIFTKRFNYKTEWNERWKSGSNYAIKKYSNVKYSEIRKNLRNKNIKIKLEKSLQEDREQEIKNNTGYFKENIRSFEVKKEALKLAKNKCYFEDKFACQNNYFLRKNMIIDENTNYLEVHHIIPMALEKSKELHLKNLDVVENTVCLCSNCHNKLHYGENEIVFYMLDILYNEKIKHLKYSDLDIGLENLKEIYVGYKW